MNAAGWQVAAAIGETRAARIVQGRIVEMRLCRVDDGATAGDIWDARLASRLSPRRGIALLGREEALIEPWPAGAAEGGLVRVEVVRAAIAERGRPRLAKAVACGEAGPEPGPEPGRVTAAAPLPDGTAVDVIDGWDDAIAEAETGVVAFDGGLLTLSPTPAMTLIDVDGDLDPAALAGAGAAAAVAAILKFDIGGSIGIDLPTVRDRARRAALAAIIDTHLPQPFERTAVNGFGFVQIVRPRRRASILERVQNAPVETAALALLEAAARTPGVGTRTLTAAPAIVDWIGAHPALVAELQRRIGAGVALAADAGARRGHVHATQA